MKGPNNMGNIKAIITEDETLERSEPFFYPGEEEVTFPQTSADRLSDAMEQEKADRDWQLSKYTDSEIKAEYLKRFPF